MVRFGATGTNSGDIKLRNISAILVTLLQESHVSRVNLAQRIGVSNATITNLVSELVQTGFIREVGFIKNGRSSVGRRQRAIELVADARYAVGIHIDVGRVNIAITDLCGHIVVQQSFEHCFDTGWQEVMGQAAAEVEALVHSAGIAFDRVLGVGVAASGLVDPFTGVNVIAPNLNWHDVPIRDYLHEKLQWPVVVENNVRAMALGEAMFGDDRGVQAMAFIYARVGVGAGLVVNGDIYRGAAAGAGEIGHTTIVVSADGDTHQLEDLVSEAAILRALDNRYATLDDVFAAAERGDDAIQTCLKYSAFHMGVALANLVNVFNPELIVFGGIFTQEKSQLLPTIEKTLRKHAFANLGEKVRLRVTQFGKQAGMIGAAALALDAFFYRPHQQMHIKEAQL